MRMTDTHKDTGSVVDRVNKDRAVCQGTGAAVISGLPEPALLPTVPGGDAVRQQAPYGKKETKQNVRVGTWNVGSMTGKLGEIVKVLHRRRVDVCCVQETRWKNAGAQLVGDVESGYKLYWQGNKQGTAGVGVFVTRKWIDYIVEVKRENERIIVVKMIVGARLVNIISAYAPQSGRSDVEKDEFWDKLIALTSNIPVGEMILLGGDLNGHVGSHGDDYMGVHGGFGYGTRNVEGERILDFGDAMEMVVCNTLFKKEDKKLVTFESGEVSSTIDYLMMRRRDRRMVTNVKIIAGEELVKQHRLLIGDYKIEGVKKSKRRFAPRLKVWKLKDETVGSTFANRVTMDAKRVSDAKDVNGKWEVMKEVCLKATEETCGWTKGPPRHKETWWWNEEVSKAVEEKRRCYKEWQRTKNEQDMVTYKESKAKARRAVAAAKDSKRKEFASELESAKGKRNVFRIAKQMAKERQDVLGVNCLKDSRGKIVVDGDEIKGIWKGYMEKLLNEENEWDNSTACEEKEGPCCRITQEEVRKALESMKKGKAAGQSRVVTEMLQAASDVGIEWLTELCNAIVSEGAIPDDWKGSITIPVYKGKGDPLECGSYRAIKLLEHAMKVVEKVLEKRIREQVKIDDMQFGFMSGKGTTDAIFVIRQMQEKHSAKGKNLYYAFVDLEKAFDRVPREVVRWALRKAGVDEWLVRTVLTMYEGAKTVIRTESGDSESFQVKVGLHQGSILSPLLFVIVMEIVTRGLREGLPWELLYADDLVLMATNMVELREKVLRWKRGMEGKGLKVNVGKTKVMIGGEGVAEVEETSKWPCAVCSKGVGRNSVQCTRCLKWVHKRCSGVKEIRLAASATFVCSKCVRGPQVDCERDEGLEVENGVVLEKVSKFCYLGDMLNANGGADSAVIARVRSAWKKFRELSPILTHKGASLAVKSKVYTCCVRSCMLYGSETWPLKVEHEAKLESTEMRMVRWMCGVSLQERKTSNELRSRFGIESIVDVVRRNRLRWFGHVQRKSEDDWIRKCTVLEVEGRKPKGRPKKTWMDGVKKDMNQLGLVVNDAEDRDRWRRMIWGKPADPGAPGQTAVKRRR